MKKEKGITLISLIIYIISLTLILSLLALISQNFYKNSNLITEKGKYISEYNKFNMFFIEDCKKNSDIYNISPEKNTITFEDGTTYTYKSEDSGIYRNKVKICKNIIFCDFEKEVITDESNFTKNTIKVNVTLGEESSFSSTTSYVLKYW